MEFPADLKYTKDHEWARIEDNIATIGITDHAQSALGDIVFVELPEEGREVTQGDTFGVVESVKAVSDLYAPVTGKITAVNTALIDETSTLNDDPHGNGWMVKIEVTDLESLEELMSPEDYQEYVESL